MRRVGIVAITILGLFTLLQSVPYLGYLGMGFIGGFPDLLFTLLPLALGFGAGLVLIWRREELAAWLFDDEPLDVSLRPIPALRMALILFGVALITTGLSTGAAGLVLAGAIPAGTLEGRNSYLSELVPPILELVVGILLVQTSRPLALRLWDGRPTPDSDPTCADRCANCGNPYSPGDYREGAEARCTECGEPLRREGV